MNSAVVGLELGLVSIPIGGGIMLNVFRTADDGPVTKMFGLSADSTSKSGDDGTMNWLVKEVV